MKCAECKADAREDDYLCRAHRTAKDLAGGNLYEVSVESYDENVAPPESLMKIARVGDTIFFEMVSNDEVYGEAHTQHIAAFGVKLADLKQALEAVKF
jgi:hypothetical protein